MAAMDTINRATPYVERLVDNGYLQENVREGAANLRDAYSRARKRKAAEAAQDKKIHRRVQRGLGSLGEAAIALRTGREKPKRRRGRVLLVLAVAGGGAVVASNAALRERLVAAVSGNSNGSGDAAGSPAQTAA
jgi:ribosomal protein L44E